MGGETKTIGTYSGKTVMCCKYIAPSITFSFSCAYSFVLSFHFSGKKKNLNKQS